MANSADIPNLEIYTPEPDSPSPEPNHPSEEPQGYRTPHVNVIHVRGRNEQFGQQGNQFERTRRQGNQTTLSDQLGNDTAHSGDETARSEEQENDTARSGQNENGTEGSGQQPFSERDAGPGDVEAQTGPERRQLPSIAEIIEVQRARVRERRSRRRQADDEAEESFSSILRINTGILPTMPLCYAVFCAVCNFILPGFGTCCSTFSICCCNMADTDPRRRRTNKVTLVLINILVASFQLILAPVFLLGWVWSCSWGCMYIGVAEEYENKIRERQELIQRLRNPVGEVPEPPAYTQEAPADQLPIYGYGVPLPSSPPPPYEDGTQITGGTIQTQHSGDTVVVTTQPPPTPATVTIQRETTSSPRTTNNNINIRNLRNTFVAANFFRSQNPYTRPVSSSQNDESSMTPVS